MPDDGYYIPPSRRPVNPLEQQLLHEFAAAEQHAAGALHDTEACGSPHPRRPEASGRKENHGD